MKHLKYIAVAAIAALGLCSCNDFLTEEARGKQNLDTYFDTEEQVAAYVAGCYQNITYMGWWQIENPWMVFDAATDDTWAGNTSQECDFYNVTEYRGNMAENGELSNFWQYRYKAILNANVGIERIAAAPIDPDLRDRYVAELRFLRAYYYFELVRCFGGVPLITSYAMPDELEGIERTPAADCYDWIEKEFAAVAKVLPKRSQYAAAEMGHATSGAALGLLAKCYLYEEKWELCRQACQDIFDQNEYDLLPDYGMVWDVDYNNSVEGLFEIQHIFDETYTLGTSLPTVTGCRNGPGDGWSWFQPTSDLENAFIAAGDDVRRRWSIIKCGDEEIAGEDNMADIIANNSTLNADLVTEWEKTYGFDASKCYIIRPDQHKSARLIRKFYVPLNKRPAIYNTDRVPLNYRVLRFADVLLMHAEACCELGQDTPARSSLNRVRSRVGLDNVITSGDELRQAIRLERRLELCHENNRIYDIRRWKDAAGRPVIASLMGESGSFVKYNRARLDPFEANNQIESSDAKGAGFKADVHLVFPIPMYEVQHSNGSIKQNPGY